MPEKTVMYSLRLPATLKADLDYYAKYIGSDTASVIRKALEHMLYFKEDQTLDDAKVVCAATKRAFAEQGEASVHSSIIDTLREEGVIK